jgi:hypothetical protein
MLVCRNSGRINSRRKKLMDKDEELLRILGELRGGSLADITDKLLALFREPEWWEEEFDAKFVARGSIGAFQDADKRDAVKSFISTLLTRAQQEERQKLIIEIESLRDACITVGESPEEQSAAIKLYASLLSSLRQQAGTPQAKPGLV